MRIYRLIDSKYPAEMFPLGRGVYTSGLVRQAIADYCRGQPDDLRYAAEERFGFDIQGRHPMPDQDRALARAWNRVRGDGQHYAYRFGFDSQRMLTEWFADPVARRYLHEAGARVLAIEVPDHKVLLGYRQAAFDSRHAEPVLGMTLADVAHTALRY